MSLGHFGERGVLLWMLSRACVCMSTRPYYSHITEQHPPVFLGFFGEELMSDGPIVTCLAVSDGSLFTVPVVGVVVVAVKVVAPFL